MQRGLLDPVRPPPARPRRLVALTLPLLSAPQEKEDPFSLFVASTPIRYCYYNETHNILGQARAPRRRRRRAHGG